MQTTLRIRSSFVFVWACGLMLSCIQDQRGVCDEPITPSLRAERDAKATDGTSDRRWEKSDSAVALLSGDKTLWRFNFGPENQKPFFHPISVGEQIVTWDRPPDHVWHHGVWFSWKFINGVNYWEPDRMTGRPEGKTDWKQPEIEFRDDHSATIKLDLTYAAAADEKPVLTEERVIFVAPPKSEDALTIDWFSRFTALTEVTLDRTPVVGRSWGGYAGLSVRFAASLQDRRVTDLDGRLEFDKNNRYRGRSGAIDYNGVIDGVAVGLAFLGHPSNPRHPTKWYVISSPSTSYVNAALLHDAPLNLQTGEMMTLRYRLIAHPERWDAKRLRSEFEKSVRASPPPANP